MLNVGLAFPSTSNVNNVLDKKSICTLLWRCEGEGGKIIFIIYLEEFYFLFIPANESELELEIFRTFWQCQWAWGHPQVWDPLEWPKACLEILRDCNLSQQYYSPCKSWLAWLGQGMGGTQSGLWLAWSSKKNVWISIFFKR